MILGGTALLSGLVFQPFGRFLGALTWPFLAFCNQAAIRLSMSDAAVIKLPEITFWISLCLSIAILTYSSYWQLKTFLNPHSRKIKNKINI
jgi:hypothetical protein